MPTDDIHSIQHIETRLCDLQKSHVPLQENLKNSQTTTDRHLDDLVIRLIDILDMMESVNLNETSGTDSTSNAPLLIKKIQKRITDIPRRCHVQEIVFSDHSVLPGKTRVLETRHASAEIPAGTIIEVCRKGYLRDDKVIRAADVITARQL